MTWVRELGDYVRLIVRGPIIRQTREVASGSTLTGDEGFIIADTSSGNLTYTMPKSQGDGRELEVLKLGSNTLTINMYSGDTILGESDVKIYADGEWTALNLKSITGGWTPV